MAKKSNALPAFEDYLAPWEVDSEGKALDEPADIDAERLKKYLYGLLSDKEKGQTRVAELETERDTVKKDLTDLQKKVETDDERRAREDKEREERFAAMERKQRDTEKFEAIVEHFKDKGITADRARRLAKRVDGDDERAWLESADELVEDGFRISDGKAKAEVVEDDGDGDDTFVTKPVRRSNGQPPESAAPRKPKSVNDLLDEAIPINSW